MDSGTKAIQVKTERTTMPHRGRVVNENAQEFYARRLDRVLAYIEVHLDEPLSVERLARVAGFSRYHFHRQFSAFVGMPVGRLVSRLRLRRASFQLAFEDRMPIIEIAYSAGFATPESFSRAFRAAQGQSPSAFRRAPDWEHWIEALRSPAVRTPPNIKGNPNMDVQIIDFETTSVAALRHHGSPGTLMDSVRRFIEWRKSCNDSPVATCRSFGIPYPDHEEATEERWVWDVCGEVLAGVSENDYGIVEKAIPGGRCAVVRHHGSTDRLGETVQALYAGWLPASGEEPRDFPLFFQYIDRVPRVPEHEQTTDVFLPLK